MSDAETTTPLRRGWTTGACASGAARAAFEALLTGQFPDPVPVALPKGLRPEFALATHELHADFARAGIVKDAGDDPDVTHGALIVATVRLAPPGAGLSFKAGEGVGTVTRPGLPLQPGEPAINPAPRAMIRANLAEVSRAARRRRRRERRNLDPRRRENRRAYRQRAPRHCWRPSILGTTGVVIPYSCSAWIHSIHRGVDVARASGCAHVGAATGETSEAAIRALYGLPDHALIEMGDFVGGTLKYLREHPVPCITIAGGPAKMAKLAQGLLDLHSKRGAVDLAGLGERAGAGGRLAVACRGDRQRQQRAARVRDRRASGLRSAGADRRRRMAHRGAGSRRRAVRARDRRRRARRRHAREQRVQESLARILLPEGRSIERPSLDGLWREKVAR